MSVCLSSRLLSDPCPVILYSWGLEIWGVGQAGVGWHEKL